MLSQGSVARMLSQGSVARLLDLITVILAGIFIFCTAAVQSHVVDIYMDRYLDRCMDAKNHKAKPGPEDYLHKQCSPWKKRSCCTREVAKDLYYEETWYRFNVSHCGPMSQQCQKYQKQDLCFYECSPNVGPWLRPQKRTIRNEYFVGVPLCESECNAWWDACKNDYTCVEDWGAGFVWTPEGNKCPADSTCRSFKEVYGSAKGMCEKQWSYSFNMTADSEPCMVLWFDGNGDNPNDKVARLKAAELVASDLDIQAGSSAQRNQVVLNFVIVLSTLVTLIS